MLPYLNLGFTSIPMYSFMVLLGMLAFVITTIYIIEKKENKEKNITNRILIISMLGFVVLVFFAYVFNSIFHSIEQKRMIWGGISWLGGVIGAFPIMVVLIHKFCPQVKGEALKYFNYLIPGIALAHAFGRIGCFFGGCCYGKPTDSVFGVRFPEGSIASLVYPANSGGSLPVLPTQLFEAVFELIVVIVMLCLYRRLKDVFVEIYCFSYGIFRFLLEFLRGDERGATGLSLTPSQLMSLVLITYGVLLILYKKGVIFSKLRIKMEYYKKNQNTFVLNCDKSAEKRLSELKRLFEKQLITEEEYTKGKEKIIEKILK